MTREKGSYNDSKNLARLGLYANSSSARIKALLFLFLRILAFQAAGIYYQPKIG
jgi:hypothetical protein